MYEEFYGLTEKPFNRTPDPRFRHGILEGINAKLYKLYEAGRRPVIIIDESQLIPGRATFEEIRLLTNFQLDDRNLLALVLIGQTELKDRLDRKPYRALRQRIGMQYHLGPLDRDETAAYVAHRLKVAGREAPLFDAAALDVVFNHSGGVPRLINIIAGNAPVEGFGRGVDMIGPEIIEDVTRGQRG